MKMKFSYAGDRALLLELENKISPTINFNINRIREKIEAFDEGEISEVLPTYRSIIVYYNPLNITFECLKNKIKKVCKSCSETYEMKKKEIIEIPVLYGGIDGPDLENIALHNGLTKNEVIKIHSERDYLVYMLGFVPGFPYLGGMSKKIVTPRLATPRIKIPTGSVGIAGEQTGIYPLESPGGWQLLGRTPLKIFDSEKKNPFLLDTGKYIRFVPINVEEYESIENKVSNGDYKVKRYWEGI